MTWRLGNWENLCQFFPKVRVPKEIQQALDDSHEPLCVACSGGSDSLALLLLTRLWWPKHPIVILHYHHCVRSASEEEEKQMRELAAQLQLPLEVGHRKKTTDILPTEAELREARYAFFEKRLRWHQSPFLLLGHHQDDRLETVLMRLVRGVSFEGLIAPRALQKSGFYTKVRPLLAFSKKEIQSALQQCRVFYFEDETNAEDGCTRNRIRHHILPSLAPLLEGTHGCSGFARSCKVLGEQRDYLQMCLQEKFADWDFSQSDFLRSRLQALPIVESRYFFQTWLLKQGVKEVHFQMMDAIFDALQKKSSTTIPLDATHRLVLEEEWVRLRTKTVCFVPSFRLLWRSGTLFFPNRAVLFEKQQPCSQELYTFVVHGSFPYTEVVVLDAEKLKAPYVVRSCAFCERYRPIGAKTEIRVKKLWGNRKISQEQKGQCPVITSQDGRIAWIPGLPPAEAFRLTASTKFCIFLFYQKEGIVYSKEKW